MKNDIEEIKLLEQFLVNNKDLETLENRIAEFNIFESMGAVRQELRHSDFLSFILNPDENHGLHELFLKRLLQKGSMLSDEININAIEIDTADYSEVEIRREWNNIDILISNPLIPIVCAIENKLFSGEHSDQLKRYKNIIKTEFPTSKYLFIFLTPDGVAASEENWLSLSYNDIAEILRGTIESVGSSIGKDIHIIIKHYIAMLERHIISDSQIAELCRKIYSTHKKAIDLIVEHIPDIHQEIRKNLESIVKNTTVCNLELDHCSKSSIKFYPKSWDNLSFQKLGSGWTRSHRLLLFELLNGPDFLSLKLIIGPGEQEYRKKIFDLSHKFPKVFRGGLKTLYEKWSTVYSKKILKKSDYEELSEEELIEKINISFSKIVEEDIKVIESHIKNIT